MFNLAPADQAADSGKTQSQTYIFSHGHPLDQTKILMDKGHRLPRAKGARDMGIGRAVNHDSPRIRRMDPTQNLDQRRFTRAVFTQQGHNLTAPYVQRHIAQGIGPTEMFFDPVKEKAVCCCGWHASPSPVVRLALSVTFRQFAV